MTPTWPTGSGTGTGEKSSPLNWLPVGRLNGNTAVLSKSFALGNSKKKWDKLGLFAQPKGGGVGRALECPTPLTVFLKFA